MSWTLCVDTSSSYAHLALCHPSEKNYFSQIESKNSHDEELAVNVQMLMTRAGIRAEDIRCVVAGKGPGSFTGLRIGFSFAKGFAFGLQIPLIGYSSFAAAASCLFDKADLVAVIGDARSGDIFMGVYWGDLEQAFKPLLPVQLVPVERYSLLLEGLIKDQNINPSRVVSVNMGVALEAVVSEAAMPDLALGLWQLYCWEKRLGVTWHYDLREITEIQPDYIRQAAARTIKERQESKV